MSLFHRDNPVSDASFQIAFGRTAGFSTIALENLPEFWIELYKELKQICTIIKGILMNQPKFWEDRIMPPLTLSSFIVTLDMVLDID